ncbi:MAG: hypothetical protein HW405_764 [Candidatus Berkelbacteria bacterium]|nr:hypothetical protein [Candidatus Berkelbacteria bacterium]
MAHGFVGVLQPCEDTHQAIQVGVGVASITGAQGTDSGRLAQHPLQGVGVVDVEIYGRTAALRPVVQPVLPPPGWGRASASGGSELDLAEAAGIQDLLDHHVLGPEPQDLADHHLHVGLLRGRDHRLTVFDSERHRFLAEHVLACGGDLLDNLAVEVGGDTDIHHIHLAIGEHFINARVHRDVVHLGELQTAFLVDIRTCHQLSIRQRGMTLGVGPTHEAPTG